MSKNLTDVTIGPLLILTAMICGVGWRVRSLHLGRAILCVMEVEAVTDVTEQPWWRLLLGGAFVKTEEERGS